MCWLKHITNFYICLNTGQLYIVTPITTVKDPLNETNCSQAKLSLISRYKDLLRLKLENEALVKKGKLRTFYTFKSTLQKEFRYFDEPDSSEVSNKIKNQHAQIRKSND